MRKYILSGSALLINFFAAAQHEPAGFKKENGPGIHPVIRLSAPKSFAYHLPASGPLVKYVDGHKLFEAGIRRAALWGNWQSWYASGQLCDSGKLVNNIPDGEWKYWNREGQLLAIRYYDAEKYQRVMQEIQTYNRKRSFYKLASLAQENKTLAFHYLSAAYSFPEGRNIKAESLQDLVQLNTRGETYHPVFNASLHEGLYLNYFSNGQAKDSGTYRDGLRTGHWVHRDVPGGYTLSGSYEHGQKTRQWKLYNSHGQLAELLDYRKGEIIWRKKFRDEPISR